MRVESVVKEEAEVWEGGYSWGVGGPQGCEVHEEEE